MSDTYKDQKGWIHYTTNWEDWDIHPADPYKRFKNIDGVFRRH